MNTEYYRILSMTYLKYFKNNKQEKITQNLSLKYPLDKKVFHAKKLQENNHKNLSIYLNPKKVIDLH